VDHHSILDPRSYTELRTINLGILFLLNSQDILLCGWCLDWSWHHRWGCHV